MSLPRYPEYKDSGVDWLGEVPGHWVVAPLKRGFEVVLGKMLQNDASSPDDELVPYLRAANIKWDGVDISDIKQMWVSPRDIRQLALVAGDLLISEGGDVGRSSIWREELEVCYFQNSVNRARSKNGNSTRFLYYWISAIKDVGFIDIICNKSTIAHFTAEKVAAVPVPYPTPEEQQTIAAFLDRETGKIDVLIAEQRRLVELLAEKRQAVISHAVTKGLNPNAKMKNSGIEWLDGRSGFNPTTHAEHPPRRVKTRPTNGVPAHWEVKRLKHSLRLLTEKTDRSENPIALENIEGWSGRFISTGTEFQGEGVAFESGDILFGKLRPYLAKVYLTESSGEAVGDFHVLRPTQKMNGRYWVYQMLNRDFITIVDSSTFGAKMPRVAWEFMSNMMLTVPPLAEQHAIADFLATETAKLDTLTAEANRAIALLQERRSALISAAVTGKIDVRGMG